MERGTRAEVSELETLAISRTRHVVDRSLRDVSMLGRIPRSSVIYRLQKYRRPCKTHDANRRLETKTRVTNEFENFFDIDIRRRVSLACERRFNIQLLYQNYSRATTLSMTIKHTNCDFNATLTIMRARISRDVFFIRRLLPFSAIRKFPNIHLTLYFTLHLRKARIFSKISHKLGNSLEYILYQLEYKYIIYSFSN